MKDNSIVCVEGREYLHVHLINNNVNSGLLEAIEAAVDTNIPLDVGGRKVKLVGEEWAICNWWPGGDHENVRGLTGCQAKNYLIEEE